MGGLRDAELGFSEGGKEIIQVFLVFSWRYLKKRRTKEGEESSKGAGEKRCRSGHLLEGP